MVNDSYFRFDDDNKTKYTFSQSSQENWVSWRPTAPYIEWKIIARIVSILDTLSAAYTWQAWFCGHKSNEEIILEKIAFSWLEKTKIYIPFIFHI